VKEEKYNTKDNLKKKEADKVLSREEEFKEAMDRDMKKYDGVLRALVDR
jgi:hypothetical protein